MANIDPSSMKREGHSKLPVVADTLDCSWSRKSLHVSSGSASALAYFFFFSFFLFELPQTSQTLLDDSMSSISPQYSCITRSVGILPLVRSSACGVRPLPTSSICMYFLRMFPPKPHRGRNEGGLPRFSPSKPPYHRVPTPLDALQALRSDRRIILSDFLDQFGMRTVLRWGQEIPDDKIPRWCPRM